MGVIDLIRTVVLENQSVLHDCTKTIKPNCAIVKVQNITAPGKLRRKMTEYHSIINTDRDDVFTKELGIFKRFKLTVKPYPNLGISCSERCSG